MSPSSASSSPRIRLLRLAVKRGLITEEQLFGSHAPESETLSELAWHRRYEELAAEGLLSGPQWEELRLEAEAPLEALTEEPFPTFLKERFDLLQRLGEGGMGVVYKARDHRLHRIVALKLIRHLEPETLGRFLKEARAQARLDHPNVGAVYDVVTEAERPYLVLQFIDGPTLFQVRGQLGLEETARIFRQLSEALHECHRLGVLHRDIKPSNVMLEHKEEAWHPYLVDFGLARQMEAPAEHTVPGMLMGTPAYASPEALRSTSLDRRADVYGLGATLFETLTGCPPFQAPTTWGLIQAVLSQDPDPPRRHRPDLPRDLELIILKALEKEPAARYDSARAFGEDLQRYLDGDPISAHPMRWIHRLRKRMRRLGPARHLVTALALTALGFAGFGVWQVQRTRTEFRLAQAFGSQVDRLESELYRETSLPLHDVRPRLDLLGTRIGELRTQLSKSADWVQAPARGALGRGLMALDRLEEARTELGMALRRQRDPELAAALGLVYARLFQEELEGLRGKTREEKRKELDDRLRQPALKYLRASAGARTVNRTFIEAVLANVEGQEDLALERLTQVLAQSPWDSEGWLQQSEILRVQGGTALARGDYEQALRSTQASLDSAQKAMDILRSSPRAHEAVVQCRYQFLWIQADRGRASDQDLRTALEAAALALEVDPGHWKAWSLRSAIHRRWATVQWERGQDPTPFFLKAEADAERGLALNGQDNNLWNNYATSLRSRANWELAQGRDPRPALTKAAEALRKALKRPQLPDFLLNNLGLCLSLEAEWDSAHGGDPTPKVAEASQAFAKAMGHRPWVGHMVCEGANQLTHAQYLRWKGQDPGPALDQAEAAIRKALELNPNSYRTYEWMVEVLLARSRWTGSVDAAQEAARNARKALELNPRSAYAPLGLAEAEALAGRKAQARTLLKEALVKEGEESLGSIRVRLLLAEPGEWPGLLSRLRTLKGKRDNLGEYHLWEGRILQRLGQGSVAEAAFAKAVALNANLEAECRRPLGEW